MIETPNPEFLAAVEAVKTMTGSEVIAAAFTKVYQDDPRRNNMAYAVFMHPELYQLIRSGYKGQDIYVEYCGRRGYDKHFWVEKSAVDNIRDFFDRLATSKGVTNEQ